MALSLTNKMQCTTQRSSLAGPARRPAPARRVMVVRADKNAGEKAKNIFEKAKDAVADVLPKPSPAQQGPDVNNVSGTPKGMGADAKDSNNAARFSNKVPNEGGKHTMVTKREAYLEGTKREEAKEKYLNEQDKKQAARDNKR